MKKETNNKGISIVIVLVFIAIVAVVALYFVWKSISPAPSPVGSAPTTGTATSPAPSNIGQLVVFKTPSPKPVATSTPIPLADGPATYSIGQGAHTGPTIGQAIFDPLNVNNKGDSLKITIKASFSSPITSVTAKLTEDNSVQDIVFKQSAGSSTDGAWSADVTLNDSVHYKYILTVTATGGGNSSTVTVAPRS